jgi:hypothetical protein
LDVQAWHTFQDGTPARKPALVRAPGKHAHHALREAMSAQASGLRLIQARVDDRATNQSKARTSDNQI